MESRVHFIGVFGEKGKDWSAVLNLEGMDFFFDFDAAGNFVIEPFPDDGGRNLLLEFILSCVGVVKYLLVQFAVAGVDVDLVPDEIIANDCIDVDTIGYAEGFANPIVAHRRVAGI